MVGIQKFQKDKVIDHMKDQVQVDCVYSAFSKAFDKTDHCIFNSQTNQNRVHGTLLKGYHHSSTATRR